MTADDLSQAEQVPRFDQLTPDVARSIDEVCDIFERQLYMQGRPRIEALLGGFSEPARSILLRELLSLELETHLSRDSLADQEEYRRRFPDHQSVVADVFDALFPRQLPAKAEAEGSWPAIPNYRILRALDQGGMGKVYEAIHTKLGTRVALKVLRENLAHDVKAEADFELEMKVIGTLAHPNIVVARDAGKWEGQHYLVMEFVEGLDLKGLLERLGTLPVSEACEIARRVALALQYAHEHRLAHRDIKPKNILVGRSPATSEGIQVKVVDFGLASLRGYAALRDPTIDYRRVVGTLAYMAPEQYWEQTADIRSDIYGLGCTLYCLLLGRPPFSPPQYQDAMQIVLAHRGTPVPSFRALRPDVSETLEQLVLAMMAKDPKDRCQTPAELAKSLSPFAEGHDLGLLLSRAESLPPLRVSTGAAPPRAPEEPGGPGEPKPVAPLVKPAPVRHTTGMEETIDHVVQERLVDSRPDASTAGDGGLSAASGAARIVGREEAERPARASTLPRPAAYVAAAVAGAALLVLAGIWAFRGSAASPVDLLAMVDPKVDGGDGGWTFDGSVLVSPDAPLARLELRYAPPDQYKLEIEAQRVSGGRLALGLIFQRRQIPVVLDAGIIVMDSADSAAKRTVERSIPAEFRFQRGRPNTYTCIVRRDGFVVAYEDRVQFRCLPGDEPPRVDPEWSTGNRNVLFLGTHNSVYRFSKVVLTPLSR